MSRLDMQFASQLGYTIKLLGIVKRWRAIRPANSREPVGPRDQVSVYPGPDAERHCWPA